VDSLTVRVDLGAIRSNLTRIRSLAGDRTVMACIKGNAYGHGLVPVARCLEEAGVPWLTLGSPGEALALREAGIRTAILLFPTIAGLDLKRQIAAGITIGVQSAAEAAALSRDAAGPVSIFLKIDAGFGRVGVPLEAAVGEARSLARVSAVTLAGVFTHLPFFGEDGVPWIREHLKRFGDVADIIQSDAGRPLVIQALASTGLALGLDAPIANAVCPGSLLYGVQPSWTSASGDRIDVAGLRPALVEVTSAIGSLRTIAAGDRFGPGGIRTATRPTRVGVMPVGFSNSPLLRRGGQHVGIAGRRAPVLSVSLEHTVVDVTDAKPISDGAPVHLLSRDPAVGPSLDEVARAQERATVEVLVALTGKARYAYVS
jgi:alanine racemase